MYIVLIILAIAIIVGLAVYAVSLLLKLKKHNKEQLEIAEQRAKEKQQKQQEKLNSVITSLKIIAQSVDNDQCDIAEGSWRVCVLIDSIESEHFTNASQDYSAIFELYNGIKHMPILEARKALEKRERMKLDMERMKLESRLNDQVREEMKQLALYTDQLLSS